MHSAFINVMIQHIFKVTETDISIASCYFLLFNVNIQFLNFKK